MKTRIYLSPPHVSDYERRLLLDAFDSNWIAPLGPHVNAFEKELSDYVGVKSVAALSSGTAALHLSLLVLGIKAGDIVLCSSLTFAATTNAIHYVNAIPVFVDSESDSWNMDPEALEMACEKLSKEGKHPRAVITVNIYGQSANYNEIQPICDKYDLILIEDAAESLGATYFGKPTGSFGEVGILSFNGNKIITTGGGGALISDNEDLIQMARFLSTQSREPALHYEHKVVGYNYRLSNLLAAVGRGQLKGLDHKVNRRREIFQRYTNELNDLPGVNFMPEPKGCRSSRWLTTLTIDPFISTVTPSLIMNALDKENIESRPVWKPMHLQPAFSWYGYHHLPGKDISRYLFENGLCLPSGSSLRDGEQDQIINTILKQFNE